MAEDYYKTLGLNRSATQAEIEKAYKDLARKNHPDLHPDDKGAKQRFQKIQAAFDVLNDPKKREMYDRFGADYQGGGGAGPRGGGPFQGGGFEEIDISQLFGGGGGGFGDLFGQFRQGQKRGGRRAKSTPEPAPQDVQHELEIPFKTSIFGGEVSFQLQRGAGKIDTISMKIPPGIEDGKKIRLRGQGQPDPRGGAGDLYVVVRAESHPFYARKGNSLLARIPITLLEAVEGAKIDVPTPWGTVVLKVPPRSTGEKKLRVKGHGVRVTGKTPGDLFVELAITLPATLDEPSIESIRQIEKKHPLNPRQDLAF